MATQEELLFSARSRAHIELCNEQSRLADGEDVALSALYAAARYSAYMCLRGNNSGPQMAGRRQEALGVFDAQFRQMFLDCYDEYAANFDKLKG